MPIPTFTGLGPNPQFEDIVRKVNTLVNELRQLMLGMDSVNMFEVGGWLVTQDELASQDGDVGMSTAGIDPTSIRFWAGNAVPASAPFRVQQNGKMYATDGEFTGNITGSTITGGTIRTAATGERIELSTNQMKVYNATNQLLGLFLGPSGGGYSYGDALFYDNGTLVMEFYNNLGGQGYTIRPVGTALLGLGTLGKTTIGYGTWIFHSSASVDVQGTFKVHSGTAFDTITQANTSGLTLSQLETELNTLKGNLRAMNILA